MFYKWATKVIPCLLLGLAMSAPRAETLADYPSKPIRLIVQFTPGGPTDLLARGLARYLSTAWKQPVIVENRPGAGGIIASNTLLQAPRDGYALGVYSDAFASAPSMFAKLPYDPAKDFIPVAQVGRVANVVVVGENSPYKTLAQLIAAGKTAQKVSFATAGIGSAMHLQAEKFAVDAKMLQVVNVPLRGTPESLNEVMAGRVDFEFAPLSNAVPLIKAGKLRALAVSTAERSSFLPDVPTVAEAGVPGFAAQQWFGIFAPKGVPADVVAKLSAATKASLATPEMQQLLMQLSATPGDVFGPAFGQFVAADILADAKTAKAANIIPH